MPVNVKTDKRTADMLTKLSAKRKEKQALVKTKQGIVSELIEKAYKKECHNER